MTGIGYGTKFVLVEVVLPLVFPSTSSDFSMILDTVSASEGFVAVDGSQPIG